jgi:hypothetical protein
VLNVEGDIAFDYTSELGRGYIGAWSYDGTSEFQTEFAAGAGTGAGGAPLGPFAPWRCCAWCGLRHCCQDCGHGSGKRATCYCDVVVVDGLPIVVPVCYCTDGGGGGWNIIGTGTAFSPGSLLLPGASPQFQEEDVLGQAQRRAAKQDH